MSSCPKHRSRRPISGDRRDLNPRAGCLDDRLSRLPYEYDLSTDERDYLVQQVENRVLGMPDIEFLYAKVGTGDRGAADQIGSLTLNYVDWNQRRPW